MDATAYDVIVVGGGNAGLCAAVAAAQRGRSVCILEKAPRESRGGDSYFTGGVIRVGYNTPDEIEPLVGSLSKDERASLADDTYTADQFRDDWLRVNGYMCDENLVSHIAEASLPTLRWLRSLGVRFVPAVGKQWGQSVVKSWQGSAVEVSGGGPGLVDALFKAAHESGVETVYSARTYALLLDHGRVCGVRFRDETNDDVCVSSESVVLSSGGFQASPEQRVRYLGSDWDLARVRGTRYNTGDGLKMARDIGAQLHGRWGGCHAVSWDAFAPTYASLAENHLYQRHSYHLGILLNAAGDRFVDEGVDFPAYAYATIGQEILRQPDGVAWQVFDAQTAPLLREEYFGRATSRITANSLVELLERLESIDAARAIRTIEGFNAAVDQTVPFDPTCRDGRSAAGAVPPKSNWASPIAEPPFRAYPVTCGITFTYGGLKVDPKARVLSEYSTPIDGLFACGEIVGGLYYKAYLGGTGLTAGAVLGRVAGDSA